MNRKAKLAAGIVIAAVVLVLGITLGVTVSLSKADAQPIIVTDEQSLVEAFSARRDKTIVLGCDITVSGDLELAHMNDFDLYGSTLTVNGDIRIGDDADDGEYFFGGDGDTEDGMDEGTIAAENIIVNAPNAHIEWYERVSAKKLDVKTASESFVFNGTFVSSDGRPASDADITLSGGKLIVSSAASNVTYRVSIPATADGASVVSVYNETTGENAVVDIVTAKSVTVGGSVKVTAEADATDVTVNTEESAEVVLVGGTFAGVEGSASGVTVNAGATVNGNVVVGGNVTVNGSVTGEVQKVIELRTASDFFALDDNSEAVAEGKKYYVRMMNDIDLRDGNVYTWPKNFDGNTVAVLRFSGVFDGNGYTLTARNDIQGLFAYAFGNVTFKDLMVEFDKIEMTRVVYYSEYGVKEVSNSHYVPQSESVRLTFDNVDYVASAEAGENYYYDIGSNQNDALYYRSNCTEMAAYVNGQDKTAYSDSAYTEDGTMLDFGIILKDCDVSANLTGGNTADEDAGAAVFLAGQTYGTLVDISDCSYSGMFTGTKVSLIFANGSGTADYLGADGYFTVAETGYGKCRISISGVELKGTIAALSDLSSLTFSNRRVSSNGELVESSGITEGEITYLGGDTGIGVSLDDSGYYKVDPTESASADEYFLQLSLGEVYWYDVPGDDNYEQYTGVTSNQLITINVTEFVGNGGVTDIKKVTPISLAQATEGKTFSSNNGGNKQIPTKVFDEETLNGLDWREGTENSKENYRYAFVNYDGIDYIVIDFESTGNNRVFTNIAKTCTASVYAYNDGLPVAYAKES